MLVVLLLCQICLEMLQHLIKPLDTAGTLVMFFICRLYLEVLQHFNQPLDSWDVSSALRMPQMFFGASVFNQPLNSWDCF